MKKQNRKRKKKRRESCKPALALFNELEGLIVEGLLTDGAHHKQWYMEKALEALGSDVKALERKYAFERGIAP